MTLLDDFPTQNIEVGQLMTFLLKENAANIQSIFLFFTCYTAETQKKILYVFLFNTLLKLLEKWAVQITIFNIPFAVCKIILNIYEILYISDSFSSFLSVYQDL